MALATKGVTVLEILEASKVLRKKSKKLKCGENILDTCGTGGDGKNTLNVSTATAILASACGIKVQSMEIKLFHLALGHLMY